MKEYFATIDKKLFLNLLLGIYVSVSLFFIAAVFFFGYEMTDYDIPGTIIASPLAAHLLYMIIAREKE